MTAHGEVAGYPAWGREHLTGGGGDTAYFAVSLPRGVRLQGSQEAPHELLHSLHSVHGRTWGVYAADKKSLEGQTPAPGVCLALPATMPLRPARTLPSSFRLRGHSALGGLGRWGPHSSPV